MATGIITVEVQKSNSQIVKCKATTHLNSPEKLGLSGKLLGCYSEFEDGEVVTIKNGGTYTIKKVPPTALEAGKIMIF